MKRQIGILALLSLGACVQPVPGLDAFQSSPDPYPGGGGAGAGGMGPMGGASVGGGSGGGEIDPEGIPCDVADVMAVYCDSCHLPGPAIPPILYYRSDFLAPAASDPSKNNAQVSLERMKNAGNPMPPGSLPSADAVATFEAWVQGGCQPGSCGAASNNPGYGGGSPYDADPICTSNQTWTDGSGGGSSMYPGRACNDCHADQKPDEIFTFAGTVYPTGHEPDDCYGVPSGVVVALEGADNTIVAVDVGPTGNFSSKTAITYPATARIVGNGNLLEMPGHILGPEDGDCNYCHTQFGNEDVRGRLVVPPP